MRLKILLLAIFPIVAFSACLNSRIEAPATISLEDFFRNPEYLGFQLSPDGKYYSFLKPYQSRMNIFVQEIGSSDTKRLTSNEDRDIWEYDWKGSSRLVYLQDSGGDENTHLFAVDMSGDNVVDLTPFEGVRVGIINPMDYHETDMLIEMNKRNPQLFDLYRINIATGELAMIAESGDGATVWTVDHDDQVRVALETDGVNSMVFYRENDQSDFVKKFEMSYKDTFRPLFFTPDNQHLYALSNLNRDKLALVKYDFAQNRELEVVFEHPEADIEEVWNSPTRKVLTDLWYMTWRWERQSFDSLMDEVHTKMEARFPNHMIWDEDFDLAENRFIFLAFNDRNPGTYYLYERNTDSITKLADASPWIKEEQLVEMKPISYKSRDGLTIHGYLTLPKGRAAKDLPVIVHPHGGPWARDTWTYNPLVQFFANRGYAVFQMNFRGSTGYGKEFVQASFKEWGGAMQDDITDGVKWLIDEGVADPERVCIFGGSYGGYATLAGVTFTPDLYACGVDYVGISNLFTFLETIPPYWIPYRDMWYEEVGHPEKDKELLTAKSPIFHVDQIKAPLLIAHGSNDPRVNQDESDQIVNALRERGIDVKYIVKENEGHGFRNEENRFELYREMEKFFDKHLN
jgi:dipeptidyl aminopeptidase/acylaminoacyl peptidase